MRAAHKLDSTLPLPHVSRSRYLRSQRDNLGWETWPEDILRHVCAAYLMAEWQDGGRVPAELGDSAGILLRHYRELVWKEDAARSWKLISPDRTATGQSQGRAASDRRE